MKVTISLTHNCNLACQYCYSGKKFNKSMAFDTAVKILEFAIAKSNNTRSLQINFFGGEPFLCFDLMRELTDCALQLSSKSGQLVSIGVTTNGTLLNNDAMKFLMDYDIDLCISLDGPSEIHNRQRVFPNGVGSFDKVFYNLKKALAELSSVQVNAVYEPSTLSALPDVMDFFIETDVPVVHLNPDITAQWDIASCQALAPLFEQVADRYVSCYQRGRELAVNIIDSKAILFMKGGYEPEDRCCMGETELGFAPSGNIYACERFIGKDYDPRFRMGNIHTGFDNKRLCQIASMRGNNNSECVRCNFKPYCMNWCGCTNFFMTGLSNQAGAALCAGERAAIGAAKRVFTALSDDDLFIDHLFYYLQEKRCANPNKGEEDPNHDWQIYMESRDYVPRDRSGVCKTSGGSSRFGRYRSETATRVARAFPRLSTMALVEPVSEGNSQQVD